MYTVYVILTNTKILYVDEIPLYNSVFEVNEYEMLHVTKI